MNDETTKALNALLSRLEGKLNADVIALFGPIQAGVEYKVRTALEAVTNRKRKLAVILNTERAAAGTLTNAEFAILTKYDLAELHQFEMARDLSISLLRKWLATYKFKDWNLSKSRQRAITQEDRESRAEEIANRLMENQRWGSHGRGIPMSVLRDELKLKIDDFGADPELSDLVRRYFDLTVDLMVRNSIPHLAHTRGYL